MRAMLVWERACSR